MANRKWPYSGLGAFERKLQAESRPSFARAQVALVRLLQTHIPARWRHLYEFHEALQRILMRQVIALM